MKGNALNHTPAPNPIEAAIKDAFDAEDFEQAATMFIQHYGGEILAFIAGRARNESAASEIFSDFAEDYWRGLPGFRWRTSMRSWAYTLARNAFYRYSKAAHRNPVTHASMSQQSRFLVAANKLRSATRRHLRTEIKSKMRELREQLPQDDQALLVLRIDRKMSWNELAAIMSGEGDDMDDKDMIRWAARLRQRFITVKNRLKELARREGLLDEEDVRV